MSFAYLSRLAVAAAVTGAQVAGWLDPAQAQASRAVLDDRGTSVLNPVVGMHWGAFGRGTTGQAVTGATRVVVHLATAPWIGRRVRIYMTLARTDNVDVAAEWPAGGVLLAGSLVSAGRALVYEGAVRESQLRDVLAVTLSTDGRRLITATALTFSFEIEVMP